MPLIMLPDLIVGGVWICVALLAVRLSGSLPVLAGVIAAAWLVVEFLPEAIFWHRAVIVHLLLSSPRWLPRTWIARVSLLAQYGAGLWVAPWTHAVGAVVLGLTVLLAYAAEHRYDRVLARDIAVIMAVLAFALPVLLPLDRASAVSTAWLYASAIVLVALLALVAGRLDARTRAPLDLIVELGPTSDVVRATRDVILAGRLREEHERLLGQIDHAIRQLSESRRRIAESALLASEELREDLAVRVQQPLAQLAASMSFATDENLDMAHRHLVAAAADIDAITRGLGPRSLVDGLNPALHELAASSPVPTTVKATLEDMDEIAARTLYLVCSEALTNIAKHSRASRASIVVSADGSSFEVVVTDDGRGGADPRKGSGLEGLRDRVNAVAGRFQLTSTAKGTRVAASVPRTRRRETDAQRPRVGP